MTKQASSLCDEIIMNRIYLIRDQKVMLDRDLAQLYGVETKQLKRQVLRNIERFPEDFMFELTKEELEFLRCQIGTFSDLKITYLPFAFTEQGVAMLSSVLSSRKAIAVNLQIIRVFVQIRKALIENTDLRLAIEDLRKQTYNNTQNIELVFKYLDELLDKQENAIPPNRIGFKRS